MPTERSFCREPAAYLEGIFALKVTKVQAALKQCDEANGGPCVVQCGRAEHIHSSWVAQLERW